MSDVDDLSSEAQALVQQVQQASDEFLILVEQRHTDGAAEYGAYTYLKNDTIKMALEELADLMNYTQYTAIRLILLGKRLEADLQSTTPAMGSQAFIPVHPKED